MDNKILNNLMFNLLDLKYKSLAYKVKLNNLNLLDHNVTNKLLVWTNNFQKLNNYKLNSNKLNNNYNHVNLNHNNTKVK